MCITRCVTGDPDVEKVHLSHRDEESKKDCRVKPLQKDNEAVKAPLTAICDINPIIKITFIKARERTVIRFHNQMLKVAHEQTWDPF